MDFRRTRALFRALRSFVTIPGFISLLGIAVALGVHWIESSLTWDDPSWLPTWLRVPVDTAQAVLSTIAAGAMSALVMVYSIVLLVYTMAASSIGPRLLQRFREDLVNQIAVGVLGATFLYSLLGIWLIREQYQLHIFPAIGLTLAVLSVLGLLYFVNRVSSRVTIDQEAAQIAASLSDQMEKVLERGVTLKSEEVVLPPGSEWHVTTKRSGYIDTIAGPALTEDACKHDAVVVYDVRPGDFVMAGERLAIVVGDRDDELCAAVVRSAPLLEARTPDGDLRFSVNLLVEIALRALSPGVNDTFTAIGCVDHLSATVSRAWKEGLSLGVFSDEEGTVRVVFPSIDAHTLFEEAFPPLRRAARGNGLMTDALATALGRMARAARKDQRGPFIDQLCKLRDNLEGSSLPPVDQDWAAEKIGKILDDLGHASKEDGPGSSPVAHAQRKPPDPQPA